MSIQKQTDSQESLEFIFKIRVNAGGASQQCRLKPAEVSLSSVALKKPCEKSTLGPEAILSEAQSTSQCFPLEPTRPSAQFSALHLHPCIIPMR